MLTPDQARVISEQFEELQAQFARNICQIANATIEELMVQEAGAFAIIRCQIEADDGMTRELFADIDLFEEDFTLLSERDYNEAADSGLYVDKTASIPELP